MEMKLLFLVCLAVISTSQLSQGKLTGKFTKWQRDGDCTRPAEGACSQTGTCCGKLKGSSRFVRSCINAGTCSPTKVTVRQRKCTIRCIDELTYTAWEAAEACQRPAKGKCAAEGTCCNRPVGRQLFVRECIVEGQCPAKNLQKKKVCRIDCEAETCAEGYFMCNDGTCIPPGNDCDVQLNCPDGSDELYGPQLFGDNSASQCSCSDDEFLCEEWWKEAEEVEGYGWYSQPCIPKSSVCDGVMSCKDGSDEKDCVPVCTSNQVWTACGTACPLICGEAKPEICTMQCVSECQCPPNHWLKDDGSCVDDEALCYPDDGNVGNIGDLFGGDLDEDEEEEAHICDTDPDICNGNGRCIAQGEGYICACNRMCTGEHCENCLKPQATEPEWWHPDCSLPFTYNEVEYTSCTDAENNGKFWCTTADDGWVDCIKKGAEVCQEEEFTCLDDSSCIPREKKCNFVADCGDQSDENGCCYHSPDNFRCVSDSSCVPLTYECDGEADCPDGSDEHDGCDKNADGEKENADSENEESNDSNDESTESNEESSDDEFEDGYGMTSLFGDMNDWE